MSDASTHAEPAPVASFATGGEAEVAQAKLRAYGVDSAVADPLEGGTVPVEGEDGVVVQVRAEDAQDAADILAAPDDGPAGDTAGGVG